MIIITDDFNSLYLSRNLIVIFLLNYSRQKQLPQLLLWEKLGIDDAKYGDILNSNDEFKKYSEDKVFYDQEVRDLRKKVGILKECKGPEVIDIICPEIQKMKQKVKCGYLFIEDIENQVCIPENWKPNDTILGDLVQMDVDIETCETLWNEDYPELVKRFGDYSSRYSKGNFHRTCTSIFG